MLKKFKPVLFIEYRAPWEKDTQILELLTQKMRYECVLLRVPIFNDNNFRGHSEDIWGGSAKLVSFNLLCKHRWWEYADMDEDVLALFDTAVDTDIEGLRTTPTADPFEAMEMSRRNQAQFAAGNAESDDSSTKPARTSQQRSASQDLTLAELLADEPTKAPPKPKSSAKQKQKQKSSSEMSMDELLSEEPPKPKKAKVEAKAEDLTLDELLDGPPLDPQPKQKTTRTKPKDILEGRGKDMTLDELLNDPAVKPTKTAMEDMSLDELLGTTPPPDSKAKPLKRDKEPVDMTLDDLLGPSPPPRGSKTKSKPVEDLSLDELLGPSPKPRDAKSKKKISKPPHDELSLDDLLGPVPASKGGAKKDKKEPEEMSLEELLGAPDPSRRQQKYEDVTLDELLNGAGQEKPSKRNEEMSLDELLSVDEPRERPRPRPREKPVAKKTYEREPSLDEL